VLHGAPVTTFDLDVVHSRTDENVTRSAGAAVSSGRDAFGECRTSAFADEIRSAGCVGDDRKITDLGGPAGQNADHGNETCHGGAGSESGNADCRQGGDGISERYGDAPTPAAGAEGMGRSAGQVSAQFPVGTRSARSTTRISMDSFFGSSLSPGCCSTAVKKSGSPEPLAPFADCAAMGVYIKNKS
jgi:hypothetical protein